MQRDFCGGEDLGNTTFYPENGHGYHDCNECSGCHCLDYQRCPDCGKCKRCGKPAPLKFSPYSEPYQTPYTVPHQIPYIGDAPWYEKTIITCQGGNNEMLANRE